MTTHAREIEWEKDMIDRGLDRYMAAVDAARFKHTPDGSGLMTKNDESSTTYGVALIREHFLGFEDAVDEYIQGCWKRRGVTDTAALYIAALDVRETAFIAASCVIDTISRTCTSAELSMRIGQKIEDQARLRRFSEDYPFYFQSLIDDMNRRGVKSYHHKRKVLTACQDKVITRDEDNGEDAGRRWIKWDHKIKAHIGLQLLHIFAASTGLVTIRSIRRGNEEQYQVFATEDAVEMIREHIDVFKWMFPDLMPTLIPPRDWTTPFDGGFHARELRERRPMAQANRMSRREHMRRLAQADMPEVYEAINAAQATAWRVNPFVFEQLRAEVAARGIGCPRHYKEQKPVCPIPFPETDGMPEAQAKVIRRAWHDNLTASEQDAYSDWKNKTRQWHDRKNQADGQMMAISNLLRVTRRLEAQERFYYVHSFDWRGRLYPTGSYLHPQGDGMAKGLLELADPVRLGKWGYWHMCLHAAGVFGIDKVSLEERVAWVHENAERILDVWQDPASARDFWAAADKPYMFLAVARELAEVWTFHGQKVLTIVNKLDLEGHAAGFESRLTGNQDGSCNGIQHFTAMLRDSVGAKAVNMAAASEQSRPSDIYGETAQLTCRMVDDCLAAGQLFIGTKKGEAQYKAMLPEERHILMVLRRLIKIDRKICKRPTMIVPYGGKKPSCKEYVHESIAEKAEALAVEGKLNWTPADVKQAAQILHHFVWAALDEVVVGSRKAMAFLTRIALVHCKQFKDGDDRCRALQWTTPVGFPGHQDYRDMSPLVVDTKIGGRMRVQYLEPTANLKASKMKTAFAPNFVHSMDAAHLIKSVCAAQDVGITQFALVHDSFGVPFGQCEAFHRCIRQSFVAMYRQDWLLALLTEQKAAFPEAAEDYPGMDMVEPGDFDIDEVLNSPYFFR